jgi:hypothetical protein
LTGALSLFADRYIEYSGVDIALTFPGTGSYKGVTSYITVGGRDHTKYEIYFRLAFSVFEGIVLYYVVPNLGWLNWFQWSLAQKLTLPLLVSAILSNNPLYIVHAYFPLPFFAHFDLIMTPLFHSLLYFTILLLLNSLLHSSDFTIGPETCDCSGKGRY